MTVANIYFNKQCVRNKITPRYINIKIRTNNKTARKTKEFAEQFWIKNEIKSLHKKKEHTNKMLYYNYIQAAMIFGHNWYIIENQIHNKLKRIIDKKYNTINKKL